MAERIPIAFAAGLLSVLTPCVLPLVPGYLAAIAAVEPSRLQERGLARRVVVASVPFVLGFTVVFVLLVAYSAGIGFAVVLAGLAFTRAMASFRWVRDRYRILQIVGGSVLIALGLLLFFGRYWWLQVALNRALEALGIDRI
jgi:cytochrome c biogenesis protein CcdA